MPAPVTPDTVEVCSLPGAADYYWHVKAGDRTGNWSNWSLARMFSCYVGLAGHARGEPAARNQPTVSRGEILLPKGGVGELRDVGGRTVLDLHPGRNSVRRLSPGVYFLVSGSNRVARKVVIAK